MMINDDDGVVCQSEQMQNAGSWASLPARQWLILSLKKQPDYLFHNTWGKEEIWRWRHSSLQSSHFLFHLAQRTSFPLTTALIEGANTWWRHRLENIQQINNKIPKQGSIYLAIKFTVKFLFSVFKKALSFKTTTTRTKITNRFLKFYLINNVLCEK